MKTILNKSIKIKHLLILFILVGFIKFGFEVYKSYYYMKLTDNIPTEQATKIIVKERSEKWWLRV